jgi:hypothetical protein
MGSFHKAETQDMLSAAVAAIDEHGLELKTVVRVPGSYEKPLAAKRLLLREDIEGHFVLGIIERGETAHGRVMGQTLSDALLRLQLDFMKTDRHGHNRSRGAALPNLLPAPEPCRRGGRSSGDDVAIRCERSERVAIGTAPGLLRECVRQLPRRRRRCAARKREYIEKRTRGGGSPVPARLISGLIHPPLAETASLKASPLTRVLPKEPRAGSRGCRACCLGVV